MTICSCETKGHEPSEPWYLFFEKDDEGITPGCARQAVRQVRPLTEQSILAEGTKTARFRLWLMIQI